MVRPIQIVGKRHPMTLRHSENFVLAIREKCCPLNAAQSLGPVKSNFLAGMTYHQCTACSCDKNDDCGKLNVLTLVRGG